MKKKRILATFLLLLLFLNTIPRVFAATTTITIADNGISGCDYETLTNQVTVEFWAAAWGNNVANVEINTTYLISLSAQDTVSLQNSCTSTLTANKYSYLNQRITKKLTSTSWNAKTVRGISDFEDAFGVTEEA